ncbi:hypothetical protein [Corynebacterium simulans]|uniref:hypothetical protein n=1 Tax=Corynebacterium simulans TaxID=146827 RepID=UPI0020043686|nr:hypothetical protein [Corynebacterium simulans]MCK6159795.1 hypothetical protein [Corynebacterium simulans]
MFASRRLLLTLATIALTGGFTAACSPAPSDHPTPAEPSFNNSFEELKALQQTNGASVPDAPQPTLDPNAPQTVAQQATPQGGGQENANNHATDQNARQNLIDSLGVQAGDAPGTKVTVNGTPSEMCMMGDGYRINFLMAGPNTSCDFAKETTSALINATPSPEDDLRGHIPGSLNVASPVTGKTYQMSCTVAENALITCKGGNNATVFIV